MSELDTFTRAGPKIPSAGATFRLMPWQIFAIYSPITHLALFAGVAAGKTFAGAHFVIDNMLKRPDLTGFIGANTYDQLSQVTLRELFYWLDHYGYEWVIDQQPPEEWGAYNKRFKSYKNVLTLRHPVTKELVHAFTRVLGKGNPLRGLEFAWYWIDETRDTPQNTHDILLSRMREDAYMKGLVTTTTNGYDWAHERFVKNGDNKVYGALHVPTLEAVKLGTLTQAYYDVMLQSYSPLLAEQELFARHVNIFSGRAYYCASETNRRIMSPWGLTAPDRRWPLVVGCDFNFSPAPHVWTVSQLGPQWFETKRGKDWSRNLHTFNEVTGVETSTEVMAQTLLERFPGFHYRIFGDASGGIGTTSNAGETDYQQIGKVLSAAGATFSIDHDQRNPLVRNRVENMNSKMRNGLGEVHYTYSHQYCPMLDEDFKKVGWLPNTQRGRGKLDNAGDVQRTHASDSVGYKMWKLLPPMWFTSTEGQNIPSQASQMLGARQ